MQINWYAHGARYYDPQLAVWHTMDPLAERNSSYGPYHYVLNNPINFIDPNGMTERPGPSAEERAQIRGGINPGPGYGLHSGYNRNPTSYYTSGSEGSGYIVGSHFDATTGNTYDVYQNPFTGEQYYNIEYETAWYKVTTQPDGKKEYEFMYATPDGSKRVPYDTNSHGSDDNHRIFDISSSDTEALTGIYVGLTAVSAAALGNVPIIFAVSEVVGGAITTALAYDAFLDYSEIEDPLPSDKAQLGLNMANFGLSYFFNGWGIPSAILGLMDQRGYFDKFYKRFNKEEKK